MKIKEEDNIVFPGQWKHVIYINASRILRVPFRGLPYTFACGSMG